MAITAASHLRRMRGGAQSHLMLCSDNYAYVVKFQNNGQNLRVLVAELLGTRLAGKLGLTVPHCDTVEVCPELVSRTAELKIEKPGGREERCAAGLQFGSRLVGGLLPGLIADYLPDQKLSEVSNLSEFAGILVLDKWTCNADGRQAVFHKRPSRRQFEAAFIDQGYCFGAGDWRAMKDVPLRGVYGRNCVYTQILGWASFEPWLARLEQLGSQAIWEIAKEVPPEWYDGKTEEMEALVESLQRRRALVPEFIEAFRQSSRSPFPNWRGKLVVTHAVDRALTQ